MSENKTFADLINSGVEYKVVVQTLYQCPYEKSCKCRMDDPCEGCETWAENNGVMYLEQQNAELLELLKEVIEHGYIENEWYAKTEQTLAKYEEQSK